MKLKIENTDHGKAASITGNRIKPKDHEIFSQLIGWWVPVSWNGTHCREPCFTFSPYGSTAWENEPEGNVGSYDPQETPWVRVSAGWPIIVA